MRHKEVHCINAHASMKFAIDFGMSLISEKIRKRVSLYTSIEDCLQSGYLEKDVLPKEYGGIIPMAEMIGELNIIFRTLQYFIFISYDQFLSNEKWCE